MRKPHPLAAVTARELKPRLRTVRRVLFAAGLCGAIAVPSSTFGAFNRRAARSDKPDPDSGAEAEKQYDQGVEAFDQGRFLDAAAAFKRSYHAVPAGATLFNVAAAYAKAGRPVLAIGAVEKYLGLPDCREVKTLQCSASELRTLAEKLSAREYQKVGELMVIADGVSLREIRIAGRALTPSDFPILLSVGPVEVEIIGDQAGQRRLRTARIIAGETYELRIEPFAPQPVISPEPVPDRDSADRAEARRKSLRIGFWTGLGATLASGAATGTLGGLAAFYRAEHRRLKCAAECPAPGEPGHRPYPVDEENRFESLQLATNVMIGVTAAAAVTTLIIGVFAFRKTERPGRRANTHIRPAVRPGFGSMTVRW